MDEAAGRERLTFQDALGRFFERHGILYGERYVWD